MSIFNTEYRLKIVIIFKLPIILKCTKPLQTIFLEACFVKRYFRLTQSTDIATKL